MSLEELRVLEEHLSGDISGNWSVFSPCPSPGSSLLILHLCAPRWSSQTTPSLAQCSVWFFLCWLQLYLLILLRFMLPVFASWMEVLCSQGLNPYCSSLDPDTVGSTWWIVWTMDILLNEWPAQLCRNGPWPEGCGSLGRWSRQKDFGTVVWRAAGWQWQPDLWK